MAPNRGSITVVAVVSVVLDMKYSTKYVPSILCRFRTLCSSECDPNDEAAAFHRGRPVCTRVHPFVAVGSSPEISLRNLQAGLLSKIAPLAERVAREGGRWEITWGEGWKGEMVSIIRVIRNKRRGSIYRRAGDPKGGRVPRNG